MDLKVGLKSCWSYPIVNSSNAVIGTFAMYYNEIKCPTQDEENAIERARNILQIIIENKRYEQELITTNERYQYVTRATSDAIWDWDVLNHKASWSEAFQSKFGYKISSDDEHLLERWESHIHPDDHKYTTDSFSSAIAGKDVEWQANYRFQKANGEYVHVRDKGIIIRDQKDKAIRVVGAMFDVTHEVKEKLEREKAEKEKEIWYAILHTINSNAKLEEGFKAIIALLCAYFDCPYGEVWLANIDYTRMLFRVNHTTTERAKLMRGEKSLTYFKENEGMIGISMKEKNLVHWKNLQQSPLIRKDYAQEAGLNAGLMMPILYNNQVVALLAFYKEQPFDEDTLASTLSENIVHQFGAYIQKYKSDNELSRYFDMSPVFLCITGADGRLKKVNPYLINKTGYSEKELLEQKIMDFVHPDDFEDTYNEIGRIYQGFPSRQFENRMITKSGEVMWFEWSALPILEEGLTYAIATDITEKKKIREERQVLIEELTKSNKELKQFSYITSHNLRSPLTNMVGVFELLDFSNIKDEETSTLLEILKNSTYNLNEVLNDLISLLIIKENSNLSTADMSFSSTFESVVKSVSLLIEQSQAKIQTDFSAVDKVNFNHGYLESIFLNMITNSIKYTIPGEAPFIQIYSKKTKNKATQLVFEDKGLGFDLEKVGDRVFGLFQKFHKHKDSRGIGLYLVHSQITSLGGTIKVQSEVNHGTKFTITFKG
jgi:PAS domain S-box-containing protein